MTTQDMEHLVVRYGSSLSQIKFSERAHNLFSLLQIKDRFLLSHTEISSSTYMV